MLRRVVDYVIISSSKIFQKPLVILRDIYIKNILAFFFWGGGGGGHHMNETERLNLIIAMELNCTTIGN